MPRVHLDERFKPFHEVLGLLLVGFTEEDLGGFRQVVAL
jgi:hypothetical protein